MNLVPSAPTGHRMPTRLCLLTVVLILTACGDDQAAQKPTPTAPDQGRPETRKVLAADAVGYDGAAIRKSLDGMLQENDKRAKELDEARGTAPGSAPDP
jgi:hypothetical protein